MGNAFDTFVFRKRYIDCVRLSPKEEQFALLNDLIDSALYGKEPENPAVYMMMGAVEDDRKRYLEKVENGKKGGRPGHSVDPALWQAYYEEHSRQETAEHFNISEATLKDWIKKTHYIKGGKDGKDGKDGNLNININDNINNNANDVIDNYQDIYNQDIQDNIGSSVGTSVVPTCPEVKLEEGEELITTLTDIDGKWLAIINGIDGEVRTEYV